MTLTLDHVTDWRARLRGRLYEQFKGDPFFVAICDDVLGPQLQDLEDSGQSLLAIISIDDSEGAQLDNIGVLVGQARNGVDDPTYRLYLKARIRANKSSGTPRDIYAVFFALWGASAKLKISTAPDAVATFVLRQDSPALDGAQVAVSLAFLLDSKLAGVRVLFEWSGNTPDKMFSFADDTGAAGPGLGFGSTTDPDRGGHLAGAASIEAT